MSELIDGARLWYDAGYICIPTNTDGSKRPYGFWKNYQDLANRPDFEHIARLIKTNDTGAIGVITGKASGNVEMIELEGRAFERLGELDRFADSIGIGQIWKRLREGCVERSPSGGIHFFCRVSDGDIAGNTPLAERPNPDNPQLVERLAETRGQGGFVVTAPSKARDKQASNDYRFVKTKDGQLLTPDRTPTFTQSELTEIHRVFRILDERVHTVEHTPVQIDGTRPGDDFANKTEWAEILEPHGWVKVYDSGDNTCWRRPGKSEGVSATTKNGWFFVFTTSTSFEANRSYGKFFTYAHLNHNGDVTAAAKELYAKGYGGNRQNKDQPSPTVNATSRGFDTVIATPISQIEILPTDWLWEGRMALGAFNLLAGREGLGKSTVAYHIAAEVTKGRLGGWYFQKPKSVIIVANEDSFAKTIAPRLIVNDANIDRVFRVEVVTDQGEIKGLNLPENIDGLRQTILQNDVALVIVDPLMSIIDAGIDTHKDHNVRQVLEPITRICEETNCCLLGVIHHNKSGTDDPNSAVMGSRAFTAVARAVHNVVPDPNDEAGITRIFDTTKNNLGRLDVPALTFFIESASVPTTLGRDAVSGKLVWNDEPSKLRARDAMRMNGKPPTKKQRAKEWLKELITDYQQKNDKQPMPIEDIEDLVVDEDFSWATVREAAKELKLYGKNGRGSGGWGFDC